MDDNTEAKSLKKKMSTQNSRNIKLIREKNSKAKHDPKVELIKTKMLKEHLTTVNLERKKKQIIPAVNKKSLMDSGLRKPLKECVKKGSELKKKIELSKNYDFFIDVNPDEILAFNVLGVKAREIKTGFVRENLSEEKRERHLTSLLFNDIGPLENSLDVDSSFFNENVSEVDDFGEKAAGGEGKDYEDENYLHEEPVAVKRKAAWIDDDDKIKVKDVAAMTKAQRTGMEDVAIAKYKETLEEKFSEAFGDAPEWAQLDRKVKADEQDEEKEEALLDMRKKTSLYLASSKSLINLPKTRLRYAPVKNLNDNSLNEGNIIRAVEFNKDMSIALVAGQSGDYFGAVTLFQFDGKQNLKIQSILFPNYPIACAKFLPKKYQFVVGSHRFGRFYVCDIKTGRKMAIPWSRNRSTMQNFEVSTDGRYIVFVGRRELLFFDCNTVSFSEAVRVPCRVNAIAFHPEAPTLYFFGDLGHVYLLDLGTWRCFHSFFDDGCVEGTALAVSPNGRLLACGSSSGIVNVYDMASLSSNAPIPLKVFTALVTRITALAFNPTSEILAIASSCKENAVKLVHTGSLTLFANFPGRFTFKRINTIAFSPDSKYLALGSNKKVVYLFKLLYY